jgi:alpha-N-acetylglucosaminidase
MQDVDRLLATTTTHNFGKWVADARAWGDSEKSKDYYEWNASMLVTLWGPSDNPQIFDYSWREWSGLINLYYVPRWQMFYDHLDSILAEGGSYTDPKKRTYGRESLRANEFYSKLADWESAWVREHHEMPSQPQGDAVKICQELITEYTPVFKRVYSAKAAAKRKLAENKAGNKKHKYPGTVVDSWNPQKVSTTWSEINTDISKVVDDAGTYNTVFHYTHGAKRLDIKWVALLANGEEICRDTHNGTTGVADKDNSYKLPLKDFAFNTTYTLKSMVRSDGGSDSYGKIVINKK